MTECAVHYSRQFLGFIILHLGINVHSNLAVLMAGQVLNGFGIDLRVDQIPDNIIEI